MTTALAVRESKTTSGWDGPFADRYKYDMGACSMAKGFAQVDTRQDAPYFGLWASARKRQIFCYCEGDISLTECDNDFAFALEMLRTIAFYDESGYGPTRIDAYDWGHTLVVAREFARVGLWGFLH